MKFNIYYPNHWRDKDRLEIQCSKNVYNTPTIWCHDKDAKTGLYGDSEKVDTLPEPQRSLVTNFLRIQKIRKVFLQNRTIILGKSKGVEWAEIIDDIQKIVHNYEPNEV